MFPDATSLCPPFTRSSLPYSSALTATCSGQIFASIAQFTVRTFYSHFSAPIQPPHCCLCGILWQWRSPAYSHFDAFRIKFKCFSWFTLRSPLFWTLTTSLSLLSRASYTLFAPIIQNLPQTCLAVLWFCPRPPFCQMCPSLLCLPLLISRSYTQFLRDNSGRPPWLFSTRRVPSVSWAHLCWGLYFIIVW